MNRSPWRRQGRARPSWRCLAIRSPPTISRRPAPSPRTRPLASGCCSTASCRPTSTATAPARAHHEVTMRGSFPSVRIKNLMLPPGADGAREEGGLTLFQGDGALRGYKLSIFDAAMQYQAQGRPTVIFAGEEYGTGSSRDWAAKGTQLLGI